MGTQMLRDEVIHCILLLSGACKAKWLCLSRSISLSAAVLVTHRDGASPCTAANLPRKMV